MQRHWSPTTAINFRDLGGIPTSETGRLRGGMVFRSATPQFMTAADATNLVAATGVQVVIDLRFAGEAAAEGSGGLTDTDVARHHIPIIGNGGDVVADAVPAGAGDLLGQHYISYVQHDPGAFVEIFQILAGPHGLPALLHCAAGKDRTGVVVALLLDVLGVSESAIIDDYVRTADEMPRLLDRLAKTATYGPSLAVQPADDPMAKADALTMRTFLDWLRAEHGSAERLLLNAGLAPDVLDLPAGASCGACRGLIVRHCTDEGDTAMRFENKVLLATGGASGLAAAVAARFTDEGGRVAVVDRDVERAQLVADKLDGAIAFGCDVSDEQAVAAAVRQAEQHFGGIDCVFNAAGHAEFGPIEEWSFERWQRMMTVHAGGTFLVCREVLPGMRAARIRVDRQRRFGGRARRAVGQRSLRRGEGRDPGVLAAAGQGRRA